MSEQQALKAMEKLSKEREQLQKLLQSHENDKLQNEDYIQQMQYQMQQK